MREGACLSCLDGEIVSMILEKEKKVYLVCCAYPRFLLPLHPQGRVFDIQWGRGPPARLKKRFKVTGWGNPTCYIKEGNSM